MGGKGVPKKKAKRWLRWCVYPTLFPVVTVVIYDMVLGYSMEQIFLRHFLELILLVFTIAFGVLSLVLDPDSKLDKDKKDDYAWTSGAVSGICLISYGFFYVAEYKNYILIVCLRIAFIIMTFYIIKKGYKIVVDECEQEMIDSIENK